MEHQFCYFLLSNFDFKESVLAFFSFLFQLSSFFIHPSIIFCIQLNLWSLHCFQYIIPVYCFQYIIPIHCFQYIIPIHCFQYIIPFHWIEWTLGSSVFGRDRSSHFERNFRNLDTILHGHWWEQEEKKEVKEKEKEKEHLRKRRSCVGMKKEEE